MVFNITQTSESGWEFIGVLDTIRVMREIGFAFTHSIYYPSPLYRRHPLPPEFTDEVVDQLSKLKDECFLFSCTIPQLCAYPLTISQVFLLSHPVHNPHFCDVAIGQFMSTLFFEYIPRDNANFFRDISKIKRQDPSLFHLNPLFSLISHLRFVLFTPLICTPFQH